MLEIIQIVTTLTAGLFAGAAIYINLAEHPGRMECGTALAATVFGPSYKRAAVMQVALALVSTLGGVTLWIFTGSLQWLAGAIIIFSVIPYTLVAILPTNKKLLDPNLDRNSASTEKLLKSWGRLHAVRSVLGFFAALFFLYLNTMSP